MKTITILLIEDNSSDARLIKEMLKEINLFKSNLITVETLRDGCGLIKKNSFDIILLDLNLPDSTGQQTLEKVLECYKEVPVVLITGNEDEEISLKMIKEGAQDYFTKQSLNPVLLGKSILYSIERKQAETLLKESELRFRELYQNAKIGLYRTTPNGTILMANNELVKMLGYSSSEKLAERNLKEDGFEPSYERKKFIEDIEKKGEINDLESAWTRLDGRTIFVRESSRVIRDSHGKTLYYDGVVEDITERKQAEKSMIASETRYRRLFESAKDGILILDAETGKIVDVNPFLIELLGYSKEAFLEKEIWEIGFFKDIIANQDKFLELQQQEYVRYDNLPLETATGRKINVEFVSNVYLVNNKKVIQCNIRDITERKRVENALISSQTHLRMLVQTIPDLIWTKDADGVYLSCNPMFEKFFGAKEADIIDKTDYDFVDRELADSFREYDRNAMAMDKPTVNEEWITFANDGHRAYLETIKAPMYDSQNKLIGVLGIGRDITDRKSAEQKIQDNEKRFRAIFSQAPIGIALIDMQGQLIIANLPLSEMVGYTCDELSKKNFTDFTHPEDIDKDLEQFNDLINGQISMYRMEKRYVHKNGHLVWANLFVTILRDENGNFQEILGMVEDITERKKTEKALQESLERYKKLTLISPVGIFHADKNGVTTFVNPTWCQISGLSFEDALGDGWLNAVHPEDKEKLFKGWQEATLNQDISISDYRFVRPDGSIAWVMGQAIPETNSEGKTVGYIGTITDITERKLSESQLRDSEEKYRTFFENSMDAILLTSPDGSTLSANEAACSMFGYSEEELIKLGRSGIVDISDRRLSVLLAERKLNGKAHGEITLIRKDGTRFPAEISTAVFINAEGYERTSMIIHDITERMNAEKEITMLAQSLRSVNEIVTITDTDNKILFVNDSVLKTYGYHLDELIGKNISLIQSKNNDREQVDEILPATILGEWKGELINTRKDGSEFPIYLSTSIIKDKEGETLGLIGVATDITERKRAEKELIVAKEKAEKNELSIREQNEEIELNNNRLESLLKVSQFSPVSIQELLDFALNEIISLTNSKIGYIYFYNESTQQFILNTWSKEVMNECQVKNQQTIYDLDKTGCWGEAVRQRKPIVINDYNKENIFKKGSPEGHVKLNKFLTIPVFFENKIVAVAGVANKSSDYNNTDIRQLTLLMDNVWKYSERITLIENLKLAKEKAEENDKLKTAFLQNMSHEIRTPMNAIVGFSELMVLEIDEPDKLKYYTKVIRQRSEDLLGIINDLLDISRIEAGQLFFKPEQVDLNKLFEELRSLFSVHNLQIEKSSINLKVNEVPSNLNSIVSTDVGKLKQIFSNLIHNAFKFTSVGQIEFGFHSISNNNITFFVSDSGSGISINMKDIIFERFRKSTDESVYAQDGMGLGLAIVKGLLKLFNGEIRVESELNNGSTFYFTIPYLPLSIEKVPEITANKQALDWSKFTLLIVEDDKFNIAYFNEILKSTGVKLIIGETGKQAISLFTNNQNIDLVLMDIKLPDMSGYDVTKEFKHIRPHIPIIAQTAYVVDADKQKALDAGCVNFITKPIQRNILLETISEYLI